MWRLDCVLKKDVKKIRKFNSFDVDQIKSAIYFT